MDDWWYPFPYVIPGYYEGKRKIEEFVAHDAENAGNAICLRAGFVAGTRRTLPGLPTSVKITVPLDGLYEVVNRLCPTIGVEDLAGAAVRFVLSERKAETVLVPNDAIPGYFKQPRAPTAPEGPGPDPGLMTGWPLARTQMGAGPFLLGEKLTAFDFGIAAFLAGALDNEPATWMTTIAREYQPVVDYAERVQAAVGAYCRERV